jgi:hypothetical protein
MRLTRLYEELGWDNVGLEDPGINASALNADRGAAWSQLVLRYKRGHIDIQGLIPEAVAGLLSGKYDEQGWYEIGGMFNIDERDMEEILLIARSKIHPERKEELISNILYQVM